MLKYSYCHGVGRPRGGQWRWHPRWIFQFWMLRVHTGLDVAFDALESPKHFTEIGMSGSHFDKTLQTVSCESDMWKISTNGLRKHSSADINRKKEKLLSGVNIARSLERN